MPDFSGLYPDDGAQTYQSVYTNQQSLEEDILALLQSACGFRLALYMLEQLGSARICEPSPVPTALKNLSEEWLDAIARVAPEQYLRLMCHLRGLPPLTFKEILP